MTPIRRRADRRRRIHLLLIATGLGLIPLSHPVPATGATALVSVPAGTPGLSSLGLALDCGAYEDGDRVVFAAGALDLAALAAAGAAVDILVPDLERHYQSRLLAERDRWADAPRGGGFGFGSMGGYYTWSEVIAKLDEMRADYPSLVAARQSIGLSHEGRDLWMVKISDNADANENEPEMLFTALTHAREPQGMAVVLYYMFYLLESYGTDPEATYLVNERELYFVPVVNPDGYVYNQTTNPNGGGLWRKNRRVNGGGIFGVDLNRNYGYRWGFDNVGSSPSPSSDTYRGPAPFSEPETSAIRAFHQGRTIWNGFHYHAYGNYLIHPYAYAAAAFPPAPDLALYTRYGAALSAMNGYLVGNFAQTLGYLGNGEVIDWSYGEQVEKNKVFAILPEVGGAGDGFWPPPSRIVPIAEANRGPNLYYTWIAGARAELLGVASDSLVPAGGSGEVVVTLENLGLGAPAADVTLELTTSDPLVTIDDPILPFPAVPPLASGSNLGNPLVFTVAPNAPAGHLITLHLTVRQGPVVRATRVLTAEVSGLSAIDGDQGAPPALGLALALAPNPAPGRAVLRFALPEGGPYQVTVYDVHGRLRLAEHVPHAAAGEHRVALGGRGASGERWPNGVYLVGVTAGSRHAEARWVIVE
jgi:Zinc carboxypeptidase